MILQCATVLALIGLSFAQNDLIAKTSYGSIQGYASASSNGTKVRIFKAVPFAAPPIGLRRWKLPIEPKKWEGVKDGTKYPAACMSNSTISKSPQPWVDEDCLYLNAFVPGECSAKNKCPVIVFLHGGAMNYGSATYFNDSALIETYAANGVILVIPAYRLGFATQFSLGDDQELVPHNLGLYDILEALKFMKKESTAFGGDPDSITLMGHSFGGALTTLLAFSPVRKLQVDIDRFIMMSPGVVFDVPELNQNLSKEMIKRAGCFNISKRVTLDCMRKKSGLELLAIQRRMEEEAKSTVDIFGGVIFRPPLFPYKSVPELMKNPPKVNVLIGSTAGEFDHKPAVVEKELGTLVGAKNSAELGEFYFNQTQSGKNNQTHTPSSQVVYVDVYMAARAVMQEGKKAFLYSFDQASHFKHTDDLSYLMGIHVFERDENEKEIAKFYPQYFLNFSKYGEPSPDWKPMNTQDRYLSIQVNLTTGRMPELRNDYEKETIDFWIRKAPSIDKMITVSKATGVRTQWGKSGFRDMLLEEKPKTSTNETLTPVVIVHMSYFPSFILISSVLIFGMVLGRYFLRHATSNEERLWILGPAQGMRIDRGKALALDEQIF